MTAEKTLGSGNIRRSSRFPINIDLSLNSAQVQVGRRFFTVQYDKGDVSEYNRRFIEILEKIRVLTQVNLKLPDDEYRRFMGELREVGEEAYTSFREAGIAQYIDEVEQRESQRGISLDFTFPPGMSLLWQMMYTGDTYEDKVYPDKFWGFRYPIGNLFWESDTGSTIKLRSGIFASTHEDLECSVTELKKIQDELDKILGKHNFVVKHLEEAIVLEELCSKEVFKYFEREDFGYGVVHFACHCLNPKKDVSQASLLMTAKEIELELALKTFNTLAGQNHKFRFRPLVFLNACESATPLHLLQSLNFPWSLIKFGAGGVIATACTMPDNFASAFATEFYKRLLEKSRDQTNASIAETLMETSRHFLIMENNPLGLAYGLYSETNQQLELE
jgi:hypothetical protein